MSRTDRIIGIVLGIVVGIVVLIAFVFFGSEDAIDAPSIEGSGAQQSTTSSR